MRNSRPGKAEPRQYKRRIPPCRDQTFHMLSQDVIYEDFIILLGSWPDVSANWDHVIII